jgi:hypothetical protein
MEISSKFIRLMQCVLVCASFIISPVAMSQDQVDQIVNTGVERAEEGKASQGRVDNTADKTNDIAQEYKKELKVIDGLKVYNALLQKQLDDQQLEITQLKESIANVSVIERQITPLMLKMTDSLEQFIALDVPFLEEERTDRVARLRETIARADVTAAEKFRSVLEAYQIESEYGRTIEAYKDVLDIDGAPREVSLLRFGRVSLVYQTEDRLLNGAWDQSARQWSSLDAAEYRNQITNGLKIARKQVAPDLFLLPVGAAEID